MNIAAIDVELIDLPAVTPPFSWRHGLLGSHGARTTGVFRITTDDGAVGWAYHEWSGPMLADIIDRVLRPQLVGERGRSARVALASPLGARPYGGVPDLADSASSTSRSGTSRPEHWAFRSTVCSARSGREFPAYASTTTFSTIEEYLDVADQCLELGFTAIKLHAWGDARADADAVPGASGRTWATESS